MTSGKKYITGLFAIMIAGMFTVSCVKDHSEDIVPEPTPSTQDDRVKVELYTLTNDFETPMANTRANESAFNNDPMVIVFRKSGSDFLFYEAAQSEYDNIASLSSVMLTPTSDSVKLIIVTNVPSSRFYNGTSEVDFDKANITAALTGKTLADVENEGLLQTVSLGSGNLSSLPFSNSNDRLPMSAVHGMANLSVGSSIGQLTNKILLTRAMAKIYVDVGANFSRSFQLQSVGIINASPRGSLINESGNLNTASQVVRYGNDSEAGMAVATGVAGSGFSTADNPLYVYEASKDQKVYLIIKAFCNGMTSYYRVPFENQYYENIDIQRNKTYRCSVVSAGLGYATLNEALTSTAAPEITLQLDVVDDSSYDIVSNSQYYIATKYSNLIIMTGEALTYELDIVTNIPEGLGWGFTSLSGSSNTALTRVGEGRMKLTISHAQGLKTRGKIIFYIGMLGKEIEVIRVDPIGSDGVGELPYDDFVLCDITNQGSGNWLWLTPDGSTQNKSIINGVPGKIQIKADENTGSSLRTGGEMDAIRGYSGRTKIWISQSNL